MPTVLFAPDYRQGIAYQQLLAQALSPMGFEVKFLSHTRRGLPLTRGVADFPGIDLLHMHWPEAYYGPREGGSWLARARFRLDLALVLARLPMVCTAHNLLPHDRARQAFVRANHRFVFRRSKAVFTHSSAALESLVQTYGVNRATCHVMPLGDLSANLGVPWPRSRAREQLGLDDRPLCLMFGRTNPYKGVEDAIDFWRTRRPRATLAIIGTTDNPEYGQRLAVVAKDCPDVMLKLQWLEDRELGLWLSAADCALFNYRAILSSGSAPLARSWGLPILLPRRLTSVDLHEPFPNVFRFESFESDFAERLEEALASGADYAAAEPWRRATGWTAVARVTAQAYRAALGL